MDGTHLIDVRGRDEVASSGALGDSVSIVPLPELPAALDMDDEDFEAEYRFPKPKASDTVVFSCRSGVRSESACEIATAAGYLECVCRAPLSHGCVTRSLIPQRLTPRVRSVKNFRGSALEWFVAPTSLTGTSPPWPLTMVPPP